MRKAIYVHPWDIFLEGVDKVLERVENANFNTINIATSYHSGRFILPHSPLQRVISVEEGVVYFDVDENYFKDSRLKPEKSRQFKNRDVLKELNAANRSNHLDISSWTVFLHNRRLVSQNLDLAVIDPFGYPDSNYLCPNQTETKNYVKGMLKNLSEAYGIGSIQMESIFYPGGLVHGNHHEVFGVDVNATLNFLFSLCYCKKCTLISRQKGYDLGKYLPKIRTYIDNQFSQVQISRELSDGITGEDVERELSKAGLSDLIPLKNEMCKDIAYDLYAAINENSTDPKLEIIKDGKKPYDGLSLKDIPEAISGVNILLYYDDPKIIHDKFSEVLSHAKKDTCIYPSVRTTFPMVKQSGQAEAMLDALIELEPKGVNIYNYGWTPLKIIEEIGRGLEKWS